MSFSPVLLASACSSTTNTTDFNGIDCEDAKQACMYEEENKILEAEHVFVLMKKEYRISRNIRAQWYFGHLNKTISVLPRKNLAEFTEEIGVVSVLPKTCPEGWNPKENHKYQYRVTPFTKTMFFAHQYRIVFCLDLSSSVGTVDIQHGSILFDEIYQVLRKCTKGAVKPFEIPGSGFLFRPNIYVTVIAHMPFYRSGVNQVLVHGWQMTEDNVNRFLDLINCKLYEVLACVVEATSKTNDQICLVEKDNAKDAVVGDAPDSCEHQMTITPDINTVDMLRYGILALHLLPENSGAAIIVITDGMLSMPNVSLLESLLTQLRNSTIACSFFQLGSCYHPFSNLGFVPYTDLMNFIATATFGTYLPTCPDVEKCSRPDLNIYHQALFAWNFQQLYPDDRPLLHDMLDINVVEWGIENCNFYTSQNQPFIKKRQLETNLVAPLSSILSCRLREGYTVKSVSFRKGDGKIQVRLVLPWNSNIMLEYVVLAAWPPRSKNGHPPCSAQPESCHCELIVEGSYDFLHDVTCVKKPIKSFYREAVVCNFWNTLKNLSHTDQLLAHLHSFTYNSVFYTIPDSIKNGVPLFCLPPNTSKPILFSKNSSHTQFASFWKPICMLDINVWQKWMHTHRIGLVLQHDEPLPKNVLIPNSSGRYGQVQCRQALTLVDALLRDYSSFVLIENHSYIKFLFGELEKPPTAFYIIRVISKASCMVIRLAFLGGTPGYKRNMIVNQLKDKLLNLKLPKRGKNKEVRVQTDKREDSLRNVESSEALIQSKSCCVLLRKPVEKILIRYERVPSDFLSSIPSLITNHGMRKQGVSIPEHAVTNTLTTLSRYLHHHRWIWTVQNSPSTPLPLAAVARILSTLTKRRQQERFHFGHSCSGITNMVIELDMQSEDHVLNETDMQVHTNSDLKNETHPCVVQYVLFPPYSNTTLVDSISDEDGEIEMVEADGELQLITECWVEPQHGVVTVQPPYCDFLQGLNYHELVNAFHLVDLECISALITFEHLCLMCQNMKVPSPMSEPLKLNSSTCSSKADQQHSILSGARSTPDVILSQTSILNHKYEPTITQVPFSFDLLNLLPKCQQAELLFSTFIQDINRPGDVSTEEKDISNIKLFRFLMENLNKIHDREIILGPREIEQLRRKIFERERNPKAPSIPFLYQCGTDIFVKGGSKDISPMLKQNYQNGKPILKEDYDDENIVNWRCFAKNASPNHVLLTVIPASYKDLKKLVLTKLEKDENCLNARSVRRVEKVVDASSPSSQRENETCKVFQDGETKEDVQGKNELEDGATLPSPVEHIMKDNKPENTSTNQPYGFVILPVYIYDCHLGSVINQLVYEEDFKKYEDIYQDMTFKIDSSYSEAESTRFSYCESQQSPNSKQPSPECRSEEGETYSEKLYLKRHCNLVEAAFSKSFVYALFRCLHQGYHLEKQDVEAVVDGICQENLLEVDITHFLQMICGHVKDFKVKMSMEETCKSFEKSSNKIVLEQDTHKKGGDGSMVPEGESWRKNFPLDLLQRHHPCEPLQQLHSSIKQKFTKVFQTFFHPIPSLPDFYFFFFSEQQVHQVEYNDVAGGINEQSDDNENAEKSETEADSQMEHVRFVPNQELNDFPPKESEAPPSCEEASSLSEDTSIGRQSALSSLEDEDEKNIRQNVGVSIPPLFVHLTCSVRTNRNVGNCSLKSLPTCLGEVISSLEEPGSNIDLDDLQITLDVLCLTLHPEMEELVESDKTVRTVSYCSTSPMPESEPLKSIDEDEDDLSASHSDIQTEIACHQLSHLPSFQQETMKMCIQRIEWMFQDEIASAALGSFPIVPSTLDFVVNHVENSKGFLTCLKDEVPLHFVFGPDLSLDKFIEELKQMTLPGYHLSKLGEYYYLVVDPESEEHEHRSFGSLVPPLGLASRDLRIPQHPHGDDSTVLKKASWELQNVVFPLLDQNSNRGLLRRQNKSGEMEDDNQIMGMPLIMERSIDHKYVNSVSQAVGDEDKGTETEENETTELNRSRPVRKVSSKNLKDKSHCASRSALVAPEESLTQSASRSASIVPGESSTMVSESVSLTETPVTFSSEIAFTKNRNAVKSGEQLTILLSTSAVDNVTCGSAVRDRSDSISSFSGESHHVEIPGALIHPAVQQLQGTQDSLRSTPVLFHDTEVSSFIGSEHVSNTEDGYEGDSSDSASDWDWLNVLDTRRPLMPRFWFILKVLQDYVYVYCHIRHREQEDDELGQCKEIFSQVVQIIKDICKVVNQTLLLQDLHESRMCNQLLVPEASEDIWKHEGGFLSSGKVAHMYGHSMLGADEHDALEQQSYLEATMKFMPGTFDCGVVWETHFTLHPRLNTGPGHSVVSRGIRALRAVLNPFSVNNRKNMFVYQERSGSVFYLRLNETLCQGHSGYGLSKREDESSLSDSPSSLVSSNPQKKLAGDEEEFNDFRPRFGSGFSDHDTNLDNISISSRASTTRKNQRCIALQVHGIGEVGSEIKEDFVQVLQNRLDDAVLDMISVMLERNPMCKLTPEDVQFIQKPGRKPASVFHFTIPTQTHLHAVEVFLRQNLLSFLNNPKYTDSKAENRFKHYNEDVSSASVVDNNVFLYCLQQASGTTGSKGLACVIFSMVNGQGQLIERLYCLPPSPLAYQDGLSSCELNALTSTALYEDSSNCNSKIPGPLALIQFQVWCVGKVGMDQLVNKLKAAVTHALWDILMEYRILTAPLAEATSRNDSEYYSEPTTPVRTRRSGYGTIQENSPTTGPLQPSLHTKELSASVPDILTRSHSVITSLKEPSSFFKFGVGSSQDASQTENGVSTEISTDSCMSLQLDKNKRTETLHHITHAYEAGDRGKLSSIIQQNMKSILEFGKDLGVPTVVKHKFSVTSQHCIRIVLKEFQTAVNDLTPDVLPKVFIKLTDGSEDFLCFNTMWKYYLGGRKPGEPYNMLCTVAPGEKKHYIAVGRNVNQWRAFMGCDELSCFLESAFVPQKGQKTYQLYQPYLCQDKSRDSSAAVSNSSLLTVTSPLPSTPLADISVSESPLSCSNESATSPFVPRQRFLILFVDDKELTLYLYNWATELCTSIISMMTRLVLWHNSRAIVLNSVISQKLGFFNNQPLERAVKTIHGTQKSQTVVTSFLPINVNQITLLIKYLSPPHRDIQHGSIVGGRHVISGSSQTNFPNMLDFLRDSQPPHPLHKAHYGLFRDPVMRHGKQLDETRINSEGRDLQDLQTMWQARGSSSNVPFMDKLHLVRKVGRLTHFCLTPLLFSPAWRWKMGPIRDHTFDNTIFGIGTGEKATEQSQTEQKISGRSRHNSGSSVKGFDSISISVTSRSRWLSGTSQQAMITSASSSPKLRRSAPDETWHFAVCSNYIQEYIQYLQSQGFVAVQTKTAEQKQGADHSKDEDSKQLLRNISSSGLHSLATPRMSTKDVPAYFLVRFLLGGLLVFEVGLCDPYAYCYLYSLELMRMPYTTPRALNSQFTTTFLDELERIKVNMHQHSFTYDYHLRTIHSYISGRQLIFRQGYHLTSFLDDFLNYYQKSPNSAHNLVYSGSVVIDSTSMPPHQLYNYIISHNEVYGMRVLRMVPFLQDPVLEMDTEYVLVELSTRRVIYRDANDFRQTASFDVGLLIAHDAISIIQKETPKNCQPLVLKFYILLTSQRELYPKLFNFDSMLGTFRLVRIKRKYSSSNFSSRKISSNTDPISDMNTLNDSLGSSTETQSDQEHPQYRPYTAVHRVCDEEVSYLSYYSNHETMMQVILQEQAERARSHLTKVVQQAAVDCRRDYLWSCLMDQGLKDLEGSGAGSKEGSSNTINYNEFTELMKLVKTVTLSDLDPQLSVFDNMHISWYQRLTRVLTVKYADSHVYFVSPDGNIIYMTVLHTRCPDGFILLSVNLHTYRTNLCLVFRHHVEENHTPDRPNVRVLAIQSMVEDFVNACCYHLWTGIVI